MSLLEVKNLKKYFPVKIGMSKTAYVKAVDDISFSLAPRETLGLVGESGSGKSTTGMTLLRLYEPTDGSIKFNNQNITHVNQKELRKFRKEMQIVFQDPFASLNPRWKVKDTIAEALEIHKLAYGSQKEKRVEELLEVCSSKTGRSDMAEKTGITEKLILKWANHADLFRVKGIGGEYAELLEASGVDTIPELKQRNAENLFTKMVEVNEEKKLVRNLPTQDQVEDWVKQAGDLPRILEY